MSLSIRKISVLVLVLAVFTSPLGLAGTVSESVAKQILTKLNASNDQMRYGEVQSTPVDGLYKVKVESGPVLYVSESGDYIINGEMFAVQPGRYVSMHKEDLLQQNAQLLSAVDAKDTLVYAANGERRALIYIFTDVDCSYCYKLHKELPVLSEKGVEVRYLAYPRAGVYSPSFSKIATVWCSDDPKSMLPAMQRGGEIDIADCDDSAVLRQFALGNQLGVTGTPAIVFEDGQLFSGYKSADEIIELLKL